MLEAIDDQGEQTLSRLDERLAQYEGWLFVVTRAARRRAYVTLAASQTTEIIDRELRDSAFHWEAHLTRLTVQ